MKTSRNAAIALSAVFVFASAKAITISLAGLGTAGIKAWPSSSPPPNAPTVNLSAGPGQYPNLFFGPAAPGFDLNSSSEIFSGPGAGVLQIRCDSNAKSGDVISGDGEDLLPLLHPVGGPSTASIMIAVTQDSPSSVFIHGDMIFGDSGAGAHIRLIDGSDPLDPHIIYEDLFISPGESSTPRNNQLDLHIPDLTPGDYPERFIDLEYVTDSRLIELPEPASLGLLVACVPALLRRRR